MQKARMLLQHTHLSVGLVARQCGIPDYNYFSKQFKRTFGLSPSALRKSANDADLLS